ncbi:hypothetical protein L5515_009882 [Caenorhabditis briggsae]|uniref:Uncharacterized protein n=1 Tax=Caenorhabditis briggsae TaxID=6238 RepID=A0AAE9JPG6_CAEBR|nr:hypothetical protein L5515_009882 [Caenorhabditis briggsae]
MLELAGIKKYSWTEQEESDLAGTGSAKVILGTPSPIVRPPVTKPTAHPTLLHSGEHGKPGQPGPTGKPGLVGAPGIPGPMENGQLPSVPQLCSNFSV